MNKKINEILMNIRNENKISRKKLEDISGFKARTIESYERGQNPPSKEYMKFFCLYFGVCNDLRTKINIYIRIILMYQDVYNYDDTQMAKLLNITIRKYKNDFTLLPDYKNKSTIEHYKTYEIIDLFFYTKISLDTINKIDDNFYPFYDDSLRDESRRGILNNKKSSHYFSRLFEIKKNGINITPEYYASIIKKRNQPQTITPLSTLEDIPPNHKKLISLLPFAPDTFINEIIKKLETMQDLQKL